VPGKLTYGHSGLGTSLHLAGELFNYMAHIEVQQVPFRGSSLVVTDLMGGRITMSFIPPTATLPLMNEGKIRPLAVTSIERAPFLPNVPTMAESGYPGYEVPGWFGMVAPARTPAAVIDRLNRETVYGVPRGAREARCDRHRPARQLAGGVRRLDQEGSRLLGEGDQGHRHQADRMSADRMSVRARRTRAAWTSVSG
jgi:hypothetical protein